MAAPRLIIIPQAGVSDFAYDGERTEAYPSYYMDNGRYHQHDVSPEDHQAVLNEIAARPSNFGYGLGHALRQAFEFIKDKLNANRPNGTCAAEDRSQEEALSRINDCVQATDNLQRSLNTVERAEETHFDCMVREGISPREARLIQQSQRPSGLQSYVSLFSSVYGGPYKVRGTEVCKTEALQSMKDVSKAEAAENHQRSVCAFRRN